MKRLLIAVLGLLLAVVLIAPAAQGATKVRSLTLEGEVAGGGAVQLGIDYLVKHKNGRKRLTPHRVTNFVYTDIPVTCDQGKPWTAGFAFGPGGTGTNIKITKKRFSRTDTITDPFSATVRVVGQKMWQGRTKWRPGPFNKPRPPGKKFFWKLASGTLNIFDYSAYPTLGATHCTTNGPRSWSAHQCGRTSTTRFTSRYVRSAEE